MGASDGEAERQVAPFAFGARISLLYSAIFFHVGLYLPYFPLWLKARGLSATQISIILSLPLIVRVLTSGQITSYADRAGDRANVMIALYVATALATLAYLFVDVAGGGFWPIFAVTALYAVFFNPLVPVLDSLTLSGVRRFGVDYGRIRLWGSLVFILANLGGGLVLAGSDVEAVLFVLVASVIAGAALSPLLPRIGRPRNATTQTGLADATTWKLLADRRFLLVMLAGGILQASHALVYGFGSIYWQSLGFSPAQIGGFWAVSITCEILLFIFSSRVVTRIGPFTMLVIGGVAAIVRWSLLPVDLGGGGFIVLQVLHALTFAAVFIGTQYLVVRTIPEEMVASAQSVMVMTVGLVMAGTTALSGPLYAAFGPDSFRFMIALPVVALALLAAFHVFVKERY